MSWQSAVGLYPHPFASTIEEVLLTGNDAGNLDIVNLDSIESNNVIVTAPTVASIGYTFDIDIIPKPVPIDNADTYDFTAKPVIPAGKWLVSGVIGVTATSNINDIYLIELFLEKGIGNVYNPFYSTLTPGGAGSTGATQGWFYSGSVPVGSLVFISDGTDEFNATIFARISNNGTWNIDNDSSYSRLTFTKIAN